MTRRMAGGRGRLRAGGAVALSVAVVAALASSVAGDRASGTGPPPPPERRTSHPALPVVFERNLGQAGPDATYLARGNGLALALRPAEASLAIGGAGQTASATLRLVGADPGAVLVPSGPPSAAVNYFIGNDPSAWYTDVPTYRRVVSKGVYPGVDMAWYGAGTAEAGLEYDLIVAPNADPRVISLAVGGAEALEIDAGGDLVARLAGGHTLRQHRPVAYQTDAGGARTPVESAFRLRGDQVGIDLGPYDESRQLVVDPVLEWSTFLGGSENDFGNAVDVDAAGNVYVAGDASSGDFTTTDGSTHLAPGVSSIFVTKFSPDGALIYSTLVGGRMGSSTFSGSDSLAVDPAGIVHVVGSTLSRDFPTVNPQDACGSPAKQTNDAVAFRLDPAGSTLEYSTCLGGGRYDAAHGSALDVAGNLYVVGRTGSKNFPIRDNQRMGPGGRCLAHAGAPDVGEGPDAFVAKLDPTGSLEYSTCWGGTGSDVARAVDVDDSGRAYVVGYTTSPDLPEKNSAGVQTGRGSGTGDAGFVLKVGSLPSVKFSTYLHGDGSDQLHAATLVGSSLYLAGQAGSADLGVKWPAAAAGTFQPSKAGDSDGLVARIRFETGAAHAPVMDRLTYLGGSQRDYLLSLAMGTDGVWVSGRDGSADFPQVEPLQPSCSPVDAVVARLDLELTTLMFSSCLGGVSTTPVDDDEGWDVAVDADGRAFLTGYTRNADFPVTEGAHDQTCGTSGSCSNVFGLRTDAFLAKIGSGNQASDLRE